MSLSARENYLTTDVMTASPQKLHLAVIEAAIRSARRAGQFWQSGENERALEAVIHAQECVNDLICGLNRDAAPELVQQVAAVYVFIFRRLVEAGHRRDQQKLADAIRILEIERDTWRQLCAQTAAGSPPEQRSPAAPHRPLPLPVVEDLDSAPSGGLSLEA
jgi:flagellar secretion chaperone FliS